MGPWWFLIHRNLNKHLNWLCLLGLHSLFFLSPSLLHWLLSPCSSSYIRMSLVGWTLLFLVLVLDHGLLQKEATQVIKLGEVFWMPDKMGNWTVLADQNCVRQSACKLHVGISGYGIVVCCHQTHCTFTQQVIPIGHNANHTAAIQMNCSCNLFKWRITSPIFTGYWITRYMQHGCVLLSGNPTVGNRAVHSYFMDLTGNIFSVQCNHTHGNILDSSGTWCNQTCGNCTRSVFMMETTC